MTSGDVPTCSEFQQAVDGAFSFLPPLGFVRAHALDECFPTHYVASFAGTSIGFAVSYDVRDRAVGLRIILTSSAGRGADVFMHLVEHHGYRGAVGSPVATTTSAAAMRHQLTHWASLLQGAGRVLLVDSPDTLTTPANG